MKKGLLVAIVMIGCISGSTIAQEKSKKAKKEPKIEIVNGVKTLTIESFDSGYPMEYIYTGEEAEKKMAEIEAAKVKKEKTDPAKEPKKKKVIIKEKKKTIEKVND